MRSSSAGQRPSPCHHVLLAALAILLSACGGTEGAPRWAGTIDTLPNGAVQVRNPEQGLWSPEQAWRPKEELRIGTMEGEGPELFGRIVDLEVDALGRIYVLEGQANEVRVFDRDGAHVRTFGRKGAGPGEFDQPSGMEWDTHGNLWIVDQRNGRYVAFDTTGAFVRVQRRPISGFTSDWPGRFLRSGELYDYAWAFDGPSHLVRLDAGLEPVDSLVLPHHESPYFELVLDDGRSRSRYGVPFAPRLSWTLDPAGSLWHGVADRYRVVKQRLGGDTVRIVEREHTPVPVSATEREEALEGLSSFTRQGGKVDASRIPDVKPAFQDLLVDDRGFLWVAPSVAEDQPLAFDVFDPEGRYLGRVQSPTKISPHPDPLLRGDAIYAVVRDEMEVPYVVRMRLQGRER